MSRLIVCPQCRVLFVRHGAPVSSCFYRTMEENQTCVVCRERLDPETLQPVSGRDGVGMGPQAAPVCVADDRPA